MCRAGEAGRFTLLQLSISDLFLKLLVFYLCGNELFVDLTPLRIIPPCTLIQKRNMRIRNYN